MCLCGSGRLKMADKSQSLFRPEVEAQSPQSSLEATECSTLHHLGTPNPGGPIYIYMHIYMPLLSEERLTPHILPLILHTTFHSQVSSHTHPAYFTSHTQPLTTHTPHRTPHPAHKSHLIPLVLSQTSHSTPVSANCPNQLGWPNE